MAREVVQAVIGVVWAVLVWAAVIWLRPPQPGSIDRDLNTLLILAAGALVAASVPAWLWWRTVRDLPWRDDPPPGRVLCWSVVMIVAIACVAVAAVLVVVTSYGVLGLLVRIAGVLWPVTPEGQTALMVLQGLATGGVAYVLLEQVRAALLLSADCVLFAMYSVEREARDHERRGIVPDPAAKRFPPDTP
jgi:hypothetical protein